MPMGPPCFRCTAFVEGGLVGGGAVGAQYLVANGAGVTLIDRLSLLTLDPA